MINLTRIYRNIKRNIHWIQVVPRNIYMCVICICVYTCIYIINVCVYMYIDIGIYAYICIILCVC